MAYFTPEDIQQAKQLDLLTYLQIYEPDQLVKVSGDTYCTRDHDSLKISKFLFSRSLPTMLSNHPPSRWFWWSLESWPGSRKSAPH